MVALIFLNLVASHFNPKSPVSPRHREARWACPHPIQLLADGRPLYSVATLIAQHGLRGNMSKWVSDPRGDCPKRNAAQPVGRSSFISS